LEVDIREVGIEAYDQIIALWQEAGLPYRPRGRDSRAAFARQLDSGCEHLLAAFLPGSRDMVGVIVVTDDSRRGWLNRLAITPAYRRRGLAKQLIAAAEALLRAKGLRIWTGLIETWNEPSLALFRSVGYHIHNDIVYVSKRENPGV